MASNSVNASQNLNATCIGDKPSLFELGCLGPSLAIILILAFLKRRESYKLSSCNGHPGLVIPINFLRSSTSNRFAIAATFGATASTCVSLFANLENFFAEDSHPWVKVIQGLVSVLVYGIVFYPFFACLTTKYKLIGSLMGFVYATIRFAITLVFIFPCGSHNDEDTRKLNYLNVLALLPMLFCLLFILLRFAVLLGIQVRKQWFSDSSCGTWLQRAVVSETDADSLLNGNTETEHVSRLLNLHRNKAASEVKGFRKLLYFIYQPRPDFRFSTQFLSTLIVAGIALFEIAVYLLIVSDYLKEKLTVYGTDENPIFKALNILLGSLTAASVSSSFISAILLLHFMKCHRDHVFQLYRGERKLYQDVFVSHRALVGKSLRFSGYQIAHSILGFLVWLVPILFTAFIAGFFSAFSNTPLVQYMLKRLEKVALGFL